MAAQDVATRTKAEVLGGDDDSNVAKTLDAHKIMAQLRISS